MKKALLYDKAERLYVEDFLTFEAIANELDCSDRTIRNWAKAEGWEDKRNRIVNFQESLTQDAQDIALLLGQKIKDQLQDGKEPASHIMHSFARISTSLLRIREYEKTVEAEGKDDSSDKALKNAAEIFKQTFGVEMPPEVW